LNGGEKEWLMKKRQERKVVNLGERSVPINRDIREDERIYKTIMEIFDGPCEIVKSGIKTK